MNRYNCPHPFRVTYTLTQPYSNSPVNRYDRSHPFPVSYPHPILPQTNTDRIWRSTAYRLLDLFPVSGRASRPRNRGAYGKVPVSAKIELPSKKREKTFVRRKCFFQTTDSLTLLISFGLLL